MTNPSQTERILAYMREFGSITPLQAMQDLGCMRLASRISELKKSGVAVLKRTATAKNRYGEKTHFAEYYLKETNNDQHSDDIRKAYG